MQMEEINPKASKKEMNFSNSKILIVDDIPQNIEVLGNTLRQSGSMVFMATNGNQAIAIAEVKKPDLILLDIQMPEMDGYEVCQKLKANDQTRHIPIIFLTARTEIDDIVRGFAAGAVDYITKPFNSAELLARVSTHIELKKALNTVSEQNKKLNELNATKDKLFSIIAHDLRNPFNALIGYSELIAAIIKNGGDMKNLLEHINILNQSARQGYDLLENLLHWSLTQTGQLRLDPELFNLEKPVLEAVSLLKAAAAKKEIKIEAAVEPANAEIKVFADYKTISTVCRNVIGNAIKFTPEGGTIKITIKKSAEDSYCEAVFKDSGIGMNAETLEKLFTISSKKSKKGTNNEQGTGLGLIVCRDFVEKNNGKIYVASELDHGSTFTIKLPEKAKN